MDTSPKYHVSCRNKACKVVNSHLNESHTQPDFSSPNHWTPCSCSLTALLSPPESGCPQVITCWNMKNETRPSSWSTRMKSVKLSKITLTNNQKSTSNEQTTLSQIVTLQWRMVMEKFWIDLSTLHHWTCFEKKVLLQLSSATKPSLLLRAKDAKYLLQNLHVHHKVKNPNTSLSQSFSNLQTVKNMESLPVSTSIYKPEWSFDSLLPHPSI